MTTTTALLKTCAKCGRVKSLGEFTPQKRGSTGRHSYCRDCRREYIAEYRRNNAAYRERGRRQADAYSTAQAKLREAHQDEFDAIYAEELAKRGLS